MQIVSGKMVIHFTGEIINKNELLEKFHHDMLRWGTIELANLPDDRLELNISSLQVVYMEDDDGYVIHEEEEEKV